jgi:ribosome-binding ATPase YchF (GTP1/OBG family)
MHGRDTLGRRLLPIIVKDVAGLVPGAYKGRGKGNRFLADLCDADVLVHVVDATGRSDKDGNIIEEGVEGLCSSPSDDAKWLVYPPSSNIVS